MNDVPNFTPNEVKALRLIAQYRNETVEVFCLETILRGVFKEYCVIKDTASMPVGENDDAKALAMTFYYQLNHLIGADVEKCMKGGVR